MPDPTDEDAMRLSLVPNNAASAEARREAELRQEKLRKYLLDRLLQQKNREGIYAPSTSSDMDAYEFESAHPSVEWTDPV